MKKLILVLSVIFSILFISACASQTNSGRIEVIQRSAGTSIGTVSASSAADENRNNGKITGDTGKYGFVENIPVSRVTTGKRPPKGQQQEYKIPKTAAEIAYTNAVYELIQQVKAKGGNAVTNVASNVERNYDPATRIETTQVFITADVIKLP